MTIQDLLQRGRECEAAGDSDEAEAAYREADELHDAEGAILLGLVLKRRGEVESAADAFRRAEARGHPEAGSSLGNLLADSGDYGGARAAYERSIAAGSADAVLNLGIMLAEQGVVDEALRYLRVAQDNGDALASWIIGKLLQDRDDLAGAEDAYRRGSDGGNANAAFGLGVVLTRLEDQDGARAAFQRAFDLGHAGAGQVLEHLDAQATARVAAEMGVTWAQRYVATCREVLTASSACLEVANRAVGAQNRAAQRPQHEISIRTFTQFAESAEQEFAPLYRRFEEARVAARDIAARLLASQSEPIYAELILASSVDGEALGIVATVKAILAASYRPSSVGFIQGVREANELMQVDEGSDGGNIYRQ